MPLWMRYAALAVVASVIALELFVILPRLGVLALTATALWCALPGVVFVHHALGATPVAQATAWLVGPALGLGFSVFGLLLLWAAGVQNWWALVLAPGFTFVLAVIARRLGGVRLRLPPLDRRDLLGIAAALLVVPLITFAPYDHVRKAVPDGEAYRAYFTADFVWGMAVTAEISKGDVPPANPFRKSEPLRYYWMAHMLSGAVYRNVQEWGITTEPVLLVNGLAFGLAFVGFVYWLARSVGASPAWATIFILVGFLANSYEGADMIRAILARGDSWQVLRETNIDAVTRWFYNGLAVDGLQRLLLYQPHHLTGYVLALSSVWLVGLAERVEDLSVAIWAGVLLGLAFLFSTFAAIILGAALGVVYAVRLVQQRSLRWAGHCAIAGAGPAIVGVAITSTLGYTNPADGLLLQLGVNPVALSHWPRVLLLSFGPLLLIGVAELLRPRWVAEAGLMPAVIVGIAFLFYFAVDVPDMGGVWVGWRSGHMLLVAFTVIAGAALTAVWTYRRARLFVAVPLALGIAIAVPTVVIDVFNAQDIDNRAEGAGFPWTLIISPGEREAFDWIREHTAPAAVVQVEPFARGQATWAYVPAFAERRMVAGLPISMIPISPYQLASYDVRFGIFEASSAETAHAVAESLGIDFLLIGDRERHEYREQVERMMAYGDLFEPVFRNEAIAILKVIQNEDVFADRQ